MSRLTSFDKRNNQVVINEEEKLLASQGHIYEEDAYNIKQHLAEKLYNYEESGSNILGLDGQDTGLRDKNNDPIHIGDRTRLVFDDGEIAEFDVIFTTHSRIVKCYEGFDAMQAFVNITGVFFVQDDYYLLPCVDETGVSDVSKMEVIKNA